LQSASSQNDGSTSNQTSSNDKASGPDDTTSSLFARLGLYLRRKRPEKKKEPKQTLSSHSNGSSSLATATGTHLAATSPNATRQAASIALSKVPSLGKREGSVRAGEINFSSSRFTENLAASTGTGAGNRKTLTFNADGTVNSGYRTDTSESADYGEWLKTARWQGINLINDISSDSLAERLERIPGLGPLHLNPGDLSIDTDGNGDYILLGRGSAGSVFRGTLRGVQPVAGKILLYPGFEAEKAFLQEAAILQHVSRDRNIVQLYGIGAVKDKMVLVMELMEGGDLRNALDNDKEGVLQWQRGGKGVALDLARGLTALHSCKVIHRDLKSKNVLLSSFGAGNNNFTAKLGDVGVAANLTHSYLSNSNKIVGTLAWSAPEMLLGRRCDEKVDVFSLGVVLLELATGEMPRRGQIELPSISERCPQQLADLILDCTQEEPRKRPSAKEVYERILKI
jgi:hypothetical protein